MSACFVCAMLGFRAHEVPAKLGKNLRQTRVFSFASTKKTKNNGISRKQKNRTMMKTVPAAQSGDDNIRDMLPVVCDGNVKR